MLSLENIASIGDELAIAWSDGLENYIKHEELRRACPCANCQGEPDALGRVVKPPVHYNDKSFLLARYENVGGYAVQFHWADGHGTGIYSYEYLRKLGE
ncbi:gamma-butyrobetaine hydroxylase-like domain-containing protein [Rubritalea sp.]|uniref:gamma-butyrobetaine hydroxylase-like domain-containing protein n=1 Tax=Rubritalea sp. TaxID=2109375 RepID=UPI003EF84174